MLTRSARVFLTVFFQLFCADESRRSFYSQQRGRIQRYAYNDTHTTIMRHSCLMYASTTSRSRSLSQLSIRPTGRNVSVNIHSLSTIALTWDRPSREKAYCSLVAEFEATRGGIKRKYSPVLFPASQPPPKLFVSTKDLRERYQVVAGEEEKAHATFDPGKTPPIDRHLRTIDKTTGTPTIENQKPLELHFRAFVAFRNYEAIQRAFLRRPDKFLLPASLLITNIWSPRSMPLRLPTSLPPLSSRSLSRQL
jgi:hypothetical protein